MYFPIVNTIYSIVNNKWKSSITNSLSICDALKTIEFQSNHRYFIRNINKTVLNGIIPLHKTKQNIWMTIAGGVFLDRKQNNIKLQNNTISTTSLSNNFYLFRCFPIQHCEMFQRFFCCCCVLCLRDWF